MDTLFKVLSFDERTPLGQKLGVYVLGCSYEAQAYDTMLLDEKCLGWKRVEVKDFPLYLNLAWHSKEFYRILNKG